MNDQLNAKCPRCGEGRLLGWDELSDEERTVVRSLSGSVDYSPGEREATHRWCTNCWYEETESEPCNA
jgi:ribosomal protein L32